MSLLAREGQLFERAARRPHRRSLLPRRSFRRNPSQRQLPGRHYHNSFGTWKFGSASPLAGLRGTVRQAKHPTRCFRQDLGRRQQPQTGQRAAPPPTRFVAAGYQMILLENLPPGILYPNAGRPWRVPASSRHLIRRQTSRVLADDPVDATGFVQLISSGATELIGRFCSRPTQFSNVLASTRQTNTFSPSFTLQVP